MGSAQGQTCIQVGIDFLDPHEDERLSMLLHADDYRDGSNYNSESNDEEDDDH